MGILGYPCRRRSASTGFRCAVGLWRSSTRRGSSATGIRSSFRCGAGRRSRRRRCPRCSSSTGSPLWPTASARRSATGRPRRRITRTRSSRRRWPTWSKNKVEAAYVRSDLFERRRLLMDDWAAYVGRQRECDATDSCTVPGRRSHASRMRSDATGRGQRPRASRDALSLTRVPPHRPRGQADGSVPPRRAFSVPWRKSKVSGRRSPPRPAVCTVDVVLVEQALRVAASQLAAIGWGGAGRLLAASGRRRWPRRWSCSPSAGSQPQVDRPAPRRTRKLQAADHRCAPNGTCARGSGNGPSAPGTAGAGRARAPAPLPAARRRARCPPSGSPGFRAKARRLEACRRERSENTSHQREVPCLFSAHPQAVRRPAGCAREFSLPRLVRFTMQARGAYTTPNPSTGEPI